MPSFSFEIQISTLGFHRVWNRIQGQHYRFVQTFRYNSYAGNGIDNRIYLCFNPESWDLSAITFPKVYKPEDRAETADLSGLQVCGELNVLCATHLFGTL